MGAYINPSGKGKEQWLRENGRASTRDELMAYQYKTNNPMVPVVLIDNGPFMTAGVAYNEQEREAMTETTSRRVRWYYMVPKDLAAEQVGTDYADYVLGA